MNTIVEVLKGKGFDINLNPNTKISSEIFQILMEEFKNDVILKRKSEMIILLPKKNEDVIEEEKQEDYLDEILRDIQKMKNKKKVNKLTLEDIFPDTTPFEIEHRDDFSDDIDSEENIMRALEQGYGDIYGFD